MKKYLLLALIPLFCFGDTFYTKQLGENLTEIDGVATKASITTQGSSIASLNGDIQTLADVTNSYVVVDGVIVPFKEVYNGAAKYSISGEEGAKTFFYNTEFSSWLYATGVYGTVLTATNYSPQSIIPLTGWYTTSGVAANLNIQFFSGTDAQQQAQIDAGISVYTNQVEQTITTNTATVPSSAAVKDALAGKVGEENLIVLPPAFYAVASNQLYVGLDNLISADYKDYWWDVSLLGTQGDEAWTYTPTNNASSFSISVVRGVRSSNAILSSNTVPVYVSTPSVLVGTNYIITVTNLQMGSVNQSLSGFGELRNFVTNFNSVLLWKVVCATNYRIDRVYAEIRNVVYSSDYGNITNVLNGTIVAYGNAAVPTNSTTNLNVGVTLNKTVTASDITGNALFVGYIAYSGTNPVGIGRIWGYASDFVSTNQQSHYFSSMNWAAQSADPPMGIQLQSVSVTNAVKVLCVGDSLTTPGSWVSMLASNSSGRIETLGTSVAMGVNFQAESGQTWSWFCSDAASPFVSSGVLNMSNYFANVISNTPDYVFVHLGINDVWNRHSDESAGLAYSNTYPTITNFIAQITNYSETAKIGLMMPVLPVYEQQGFGYYSGAWETRYRTKRNQLLWGSWLQRDFASYNTNKVFVIPVYASLDTIHNFPTASYAYNARNTNTVIKQWQTVHPALSGYQQMGDCVWAWLNYQLTK